MLNEARESGGFASVSYFTTTSQMVSGVIGALEDSIKNFLVTETWEEHNDDAANNI